MSSFDMTPAGLNPHSLVVTPDEGKLYVAVEQPAPQGVVRIVELNETKGYPAHSIDGVNCPEGLAISPDGRKLYVASQCASGQDPVFVIDTKTDKVVKAIAGFAVGLDIVIAQEGRRLYVERGSFYQPDPSTGAIVTMPAKLSSVDTTNNHEKEKSEETQLLREALLLKAGSDPVTPGPFAVTPDGKYLLVAVGSSVRIVNTARHDKWAVDRLGDTACGYCGRYTEGQEKLGILHL